MVSIFLTNIIVRVEEPTDQDGPLDAEGGDHHVQGDSGQPVLLQEGHQESKPNENHHMDILEHCN